MVRQITEDDTGIKVIHEAAAGTDEKDIVDVVAIHGIGAHPDDTWTKDVMIEGQKKYINWLSDAQMFPSVVPRARVLRYGYESAWFGQDVMRTRTTIIAKRFLTALNRERKTCKDRPMIFVAHCFGGLVILKALLEARDESDDNPGVLLSTAGIVFFGTPFRGAGGLSQVEMLEAARREYDDDQINPEVLKVLQPGNEFLQDLVDRFSKLRATQMKKCRVACFYELKASNVGKIVGKEDRIRFVVDESSGCLDLSATTEKHSLSRTHFNMNKFAKSTEEDFLTVGEVMEKFCSTARN